MRYMFIATITSRYSYVECQKALVISRAPNDHRIMDDAFWHAMTRLATDKIVGVRIATARLVAVACGACFFLLPQSLIYSSASKK